MKANLTEREFEQFSAYLDGQLSPSDTKRMEEQLRVRSEWRLAIEELAATRKLLRSAPRYRAPRNFTLSAETARSLARKPLFPPFPAFRFSAALAALSFLAVAALQVVGLNRPLPAMAPQAAPAAETAPLNRTEGTSAGDSQKSFAAEPAYSFRWSESGAWGLGGGGVGGGAMDTPPLASEALKGNYPASPGGGIVTYGGQAAPEIARGSGGGGDQASQSLMLPPNAVPDEATRDQSEPAEEPALENPAAAVAAAQGGGPILGVPAPGEGGQIIASSGPIVSLVDQVESIDRGVFPIQYSSLQIAQIALGGLAFLAMAAALIFHTRRL